MTTYSLQCVCAKSAESICREDVEMVRRGTARAEDARGTPTQSHIYHPAYLYTKIIRGFFLVVSCDMITEDDGGRLREERREHLSGGCRLMRCLCVG